MSSSCIVIYLNYVKVIESIEMLLYSAFVGVRDHMCRIEISLISAILPFLDS